MIRRAVQADIPALDRLLFQVHAVHAEGRPDLFRKGCKKYTDEELRALLEQENTPVFVRVDENDTPVGYVFCVLREIDAPSLVPRRELYIDDLCVDREHRGMGIGTELYRYALDWARSTGCYHLTLNVWSLNEGAAKFYERMGLTPLKVCMEQKILPDGNA